MVTWWDGDPPWSGQESVHGKNTNTRRRGRTTNRLSKRLESVRLTREEYPRKEYFFLSTRSTLRPPPTPLSHRAVLRLSAVVNGNRHLSTIRRKNKEQDCDYTISVMNRREKSIFFQLVGINNTQTTAGRCLSVCLSVGPKVYFAPRSTPPPPHPH